MFSSNDPEGNDDGADWRLCIDKTTKKAYMYYSNNKLVDFGSDYTPPEAPSSVTVTDATTPDYLSDGSDREPIISSNKTTTVTYTMDNNTFLKYNYENGTTFKLKIGQKIKLDGTVTNSNFRTMLDSADDIFTFPITNKDNPDITIRMAKVGTGDIEVVPNYSDWDRAYTIHVIVTD
ncbi:hypothetical protein LGK95_03785 [Clostridium algoriphilum]|uniref:hypothetical protein n=1 Tax=Clostridium algoriphilum TaxID=198347 RepID=UPI001CF53731|nr:hypothetical protein [Clostridium algoriphilum]MCB2292657.1 hypothetical protein [Clostridium algoriphilum]